MGAQAITIGLEFMDGGSLSNVLKQVGPIPEWALANVIFQVLWGLAYLKHEKRVHRDVKASYAASRHATATVTPTYRACQGARALYPCRGRVEDGNASLCIPVHH